MKSNDQYEPLESTLTYYVRNERPLKKSFSLQMNRHSSVIIYNYRDAFPATDSSIEKMQAYHNAFVELITVPV